MSMQTKIAFKVDELNRKAQKDGTKTEIKPTNPENESKDRCDQDSDIDEKEEEKEDLNPFFREPLYTGNLSLPSSTDRYYRWIVFISTSATEIIKPKSIASVTYILHPTHPNPKQIKTKSPFFLDISGWGIYQIDIIIQFKNNFIRPFIDTSHMLSSDSRTTVACIETGTRTYHKKLFAYQHFRQFKNETNIGNVSFVQKVKRRLKRNLLRTPSPVYFEGFQLRLSEFKQMLKQCIASDKLMEIRNLNVPETIYTIIGYFTVFAVPLSDILPNQEMFIENCHNCDIVISAKKFNHLRLRGCTNIALKFPYIMSKCELIDCDNVNVICTRMCYTYRFDESNNISVQFMDTGVRVTFLCFATPKVQLTVNNIQWRDPMQFYVDIMGNECEEQKYGEFDQNMDLALKEGKSQEMFPDSLCYCVPFEKGVTERVSVRWRSKYEIAEWSWKVFHAKYTLGEARRG